MTDRIDRTAAPRTARSLAHHAAAPVAVALAALLAGGCSRDEAEPPAELAEPTFLPPSEAPGADRPTPAPAAAPPLPDRLGPLAVTWLGGDDGRGAGHGPVVVLLHGYGAGPDDLAPLARALSLPSSVRFVLPSAPVELEDGGRGWWRLDEDARARAIAEGTRDLSKEVPSGLIVAREKVGALLRALRQRQDVDPERVALVGFSQGAMLAVDVALYTEPRVAGVAALSGALLAEPEWSERTFLRRGLPVLVAHGTEDRVLPHRGALALRDFLTEGGLDVRFVEFAGGHEVPPAVIDAARRFLLAVLEPGQPPAAPPGGPGGTTAPAPTR